MARASDNITIVLTSTQPPSFPSPDTPVIQVQNDSDSSHSYPHSPALHPTSSAVPIINLSNLDGSDTQQQVYLLIIITLNLFKCLIIHIYQFVIGSGSNSLTVLKRSVSASPMVVCATSSSPQSVVSPLVWDTYHFQ